MNPDSEPLLVLSFYSFQPGMVRNLEALGNAGGWSGSRLWRIWTTDGRELCLRRWPREHPTVERLLLIHGVLEHVSRNGLNVVPVPLRAASGAAFVEHDEHLWELMPWMPGQADFHSHPTRERLRSAMQTLARFHLLSASGGGPKPPEAIQPPALLDRRQRITQLMRGELGAMFSAVQRGLDPALDARAQRILLFAGAKLKHLHARITPACEPVRPVQPAIRDIWHDHVLFRGDEVTGIVDFGSLRVDTPLADVARLVGSLVGDDQEARQFALDRYAELRPLTDDDRQFVDLLDESGVALAGLNWLTWFYVDRRDMGPIESIVRRLDEILARLERRATFQAP